MPQDQAKEAWDRFVKGLSQAGEIMDRQLASAGPEERADGFRALVRALAANVDKVESDGEFPLPVYDNQPNHKWFLENPDGYYLHMQVDPAHTYRLTGNLGDACYTSFTGYKGKGDSLVTKVTESQTADDLLTGSDGSFELWISAKRPEGVKNWFPLAEKTGQFWIRQLFDDIGRQETGRFRIVNTNPKGPPPVIVVDNFSEALARLGLVVTTVANAMFMVHSLQTKQHPPNTVRIWSEMQNGAVFTSDDIDYQIGSWDLGPDDTLILDGTLPKAKHWNIVLYSRFLNSLEHRYRPTSLTGGRMKCREDGSFRLVISAKDPGIPNWLDNEGRRSGLFVIRSVGAEAKAPLPATKVVPHREVAGI